MLEVVLYEPEIPPNTGNIMRLCANTGCRLHMVRPLGFSLNDKQLERAGMDYRAGVDFTLHDDWAHCRSALTGQRKFAFTTRGAMRYDQVTFQPGDVFVFGPETRGLPPAVLAEFPRKRGCACRWCTRAAASISPTQLPSRRTKRGASSGLPAPGKPFSFSLLRQMQPFI